MKRKILLVTERRADYTKLRPILKEISKSKKLDYFLIVTGSHLLTEHGKTINEIKNDGFKITSTFSMFNKTQKDNGAEMTRSFGRAVTKLSDIIEKLKPDIILTGFDIGANFAAAIIGAHMNIIVAHIEGGELSGTIDESIRHSMSKFAHIHFTSNSDATNRLKKMGENSKYIFTVGNTSLDGIKTIKKIPQSKLEKKYNIDLTKKFIIILQHTVTSEINSIEKIFLKTIEVIKEINIPSIVILGNSDAGSKQIVKLLKNSQIKGYANVPYLDYINLLQYSSALIGNSSSGIIEAPFLHIPTINIGTRQEGRLRSESVIDVEYDKNKIKNTILNIISDKKFLKKIKKQKQLYGSGNSSKKIVKILEELNLKNFPIQKKMTY
jgi:GDP/UDP-N,N'-diacetylbacillosamine 2-epimerase (hydrolysing)